MQAAGFSELAAPKTLHCALHCEAPAMCQPHFELPHSRAKYSSRQVVPGQGFPAAFRFKVVSATRESTLGHAISCAADPDRIGCCNQRGVMSALVVFPSCTPVRVTFFPSCCTPLLPRCLLAVDVWSHDFAFCERDHNAALQVI